MHWIRMAFLERVLVLSYQYFRRSQQHLLKGMSCYFHKLLPYLRRFSALIFLLFTMALKALNVLVITIIAVGAHELFIREPSGVYKSIKDLDLSAPTFPYWETVCVAELDDNLTNFVAEECYTLTDFQWLPKKNVGYHCEITKVVDIQQNKTTVSKNPYCVVMGKVGPVRVMKDKLDDYINSIPDN